MIQNQSAIASFLEENVGNFTLQNASSWTIMCHLTALYWYLVNVNISHLNIALLCTNLRHRPNRMCEYIKCANED